MTMQGVAPHTHSPCGDALTMPDYRSAMPSTGKYYKTDDVEGGPLTLTVSGTVSENIGDELKFVATFLEAGSKKLVLNRTRADAMAEAAGSPDTDRWPGTKVRLSKGVTSFQGRRTPCMVLSPVTGAARTPVSDVGF